MYKSILTVLAAILFMGSAHAEIRGKVDMGAAFVNVDLLQSGKTVDSVRMRGFRGEATVNVWEGVFVRPICIFVGGKGQLDSVSVAVGQFLPFCKILFQPNVGVNFSYLRTKIDIAENVSAKEKFRSYSPFIGLEATYTLLEKWTFSASVQYAWCHTKTIIKPVLNEKSRSEGPNYSLGIDYNINQNWAITFGAAYNISLSREKHGLRGYGTKIGVAYYF